MTQQQTLIAIATRFRRAFEHQPGSGHYNFADFPNGLCKIASGVLGHYLIEQGFTKVALGWFHYSHFAVICGDWYIDITADQFNHSIPKVVVSKSFDYLPPAVRSRSHSTPSVAEIFSLEHPPNASCYATMCVAAEQD